MARVKGAMMTRKHRNKVLGLAKGYWGNKSRMGGDTKSTLRLLLTQGAFLCYYFKI